MISMQKMVAYQYHLPSTQAAVLGVDSALMVAYQCHLASIQVVVLEVLWIYFCSFHHQGEKDHQVVAVESPSNAFLHQVMAFPLLVVPGLVAA